MRPIKANLSLAYACKCGYEVWLTFQEAHIDGYVFVCPVCNKATRIDRIHNVKIIPSYSKTNQPDLQVQAAKVLIGCGYAKDEALSMLNSVHGSSLNDLVSKAIANVKT